MINAELNNRDCLSCKYFCSHSGYNGVIALSCYDCDLGPLCKCLQEAESGAEHCPYRKEGE